jgi:hypothetical protein
MKNKKNRLIGAGVLLISLLLIVSSGATIANRVNKNLKNEVEFIDTADADYQINTHYQENVCDSSFFQKVICYASNLHNDPNDNLAWFYSDVPDDFTHIAEVSSVDFLAGGCFAGEVGDDIWWACEYSEFDDSNIWQIDEEYGAMSLLGNAGVGLNGLAYDPSSDTLYGCNSTALFIINQDTADAATIGSFGINNGLMIGIACDNDGKIYGEDLGTDCLYDIDPSTGVATLIGPLGINLNYAQDIAYDKDHDVLYSTGYKGSTNGGGHLGTLDLNDGHFTEIGAFPIGKMDCPSEISVLSIPYGIPNEEPFAPLIDGPLDGPKNVELCWTFHSDDPNGDQLKYIITWGDGTSDETDCYPSCTPVEVCHTYEKTGKYDIKAYAKECGTAEEFESEESVHGVAISRTRSNNNPLLLRLFERFPNTFIVLKALLEI